MIPVATLQALARDRLEDARVLHAGARYAGAVYLCGYVLELALKARICQTLGWPEFFEKSSEFNEYRSFKTHDLDVLLHLSGVEPTIRTGAHVADWQLVRAWDPEQRYKPVALTTLTDSQNMINSTTHLLSAL
jgi:hypothetical protein